MQSVINKILTRLKWPSSPSFSSVHVSHTLSNYWLFEGNLRYLFARTKTTRNVLKTEQQFCVKFKRASLVEKGPSWKRTPILTNFTDLFSLYHTSGSHEKLNFKVPELPGNFGRSYGTDGGKMEQKAKSEGQAK